MSENQKQLQDRLKCLEQGLGTNVVAQMGVPFDRFVNYAATTFFSKNNQNSYIRYDSQGNATIRLDTSGLSIEKGIPNIFAAFEGRTQEGNMLLRSRQPAIERNGLVVDNQGNRGRYVLNILHGRYGAGVALNGFSASNTEATKSSGDRDPLNPMFRAIKDDSGQMLTHTTDTGTQTTFHYSNERVGAASNRNEQFHNLQNPLIRENDKDVGVIFSSNSVASLFATALYNHVSQTERYTLQKMLPYTNKTSTGVSRSTNKPYSFQIQGYFVVNTLEDGKTGVTIGVPVDKEQQAEKMLDGLFDQSLLKVKNNGTLRNLKATDFQPVTTQLENKQITSFLIRPEIVSQLDLSELEKWEKSPASTRNLEAELNSNKQLVEAKKENKSSMATVFNRAVIAQLNISEHNQPDPENFARYHLEKYKTYPVGDHFDIIGTAIEQGNIITGKNLFPEVKVSKEDKQAYAEALEHDPLVNDYHKNLRKMLSSAYEDLYQPNMAVPKDSAFVHRLHDSLIKSSFVGGLATYMSFNGRSLPSPEIKSPLEGISDKEAFVEKGLQIYSVYHNSTDTLKTFQDASFDIYKKYTGSTIEFSAQRNVYYAEVSKNDPLTGIDGKTETNRKLTLRNVPLDGHALEIFGTINPSIQSKKEDFTVIITEGVATAVSTAVMFQLNKLEGDKKDNVALVAAASTTNYDKVAEQIAKTLPNAAILLVSDHDAPGLIGAGAVAALKAEEKIKQVREHQNLESKVGIWQPEVKNLCTLYDLPEKITDSYSQKEIEELRSQGIEIDPKDKKVIEEITPEKYDIQDLETFAMKAARVKLEQADKTFESSEHKKEIMRDALYKTMMYCTLCADLNLQQDNTFTQHLRERDVRVLKTLNREEAKLLKDKAFTPMREQFKTDIEKGKGFMQKVFAQVIEQPAIKEKLLALSANREEIKEISVQSMFSKEQTNAVRAFLGVPDDKNGSDGANKVAKNFFNLYVEDFNLKAQQRKSVGEPVTKEELVAEHKNDVQMRHQLRENLNTTEGMLDAINYLHEKKQSLGESIIFLKQFTDSPHAKAANAKLELITGPVIQLTERLRDLSATQAEYHQASKYQNSANMYDALYQIQADNLEAKTPTIGSFKPVLFEIHQQDPELFQAIRVKTGRLTDTDENKEIGNNVFSKAVDSVGNQLLKQAKKTLTPPEPEKKSVNIDTSLTHD